MSFPCMDNLPEYIPMEEKIQYNSWPLGQIPKEFQRPELDQVKEKYPFNDPREVIDIFERKVAEFAGCKYAIAVDCCTHAIELSLRYLISIGELKKKKDIGIPAHTYISIPQMINRLGLSCVYHNDPWTGVYQLQGSRVYDGATRWTEMMFTGGNALHCVSFQIKKTLCIGKGGMILTDDEAAYNWLKLARYDGRDMSIPYDQPGHVKMIGYHYYMEPESAARGLLLMEKISGGKDTGNSTTYPNVEKMMASCEMK